ncbi:MAG TPA: nucleotidyl transferase AbiEii/AbiGii toxin family protein [Candidatus Hydrogenedentes bacterium]|nr:nucleotidyl transferase AbiEii/AbiGii toxin family protein [Candidatus Hydrogenedentota bacterium]HOC73073.1 nucleotidyl transferase AbiEii/AbiGii toxin family protein [Candidatus Hydrogenedentota bacterium]HOH50494.1 nucleotidyl transferase AbiEii/AbiGii toxin family protein [Candidatus Hydrogenedentota bacterium]HQL93911.1 nucleotidyl transferase AbiEii/AbiGii toxin family protein [Candidatus Hydrogenedentota bacterium]
MSPPLSHSIQARLLNYSRARQVNHSHTLARYGVERLLYRLSRSRHADRFVLKGAVLFFLWMENGHRPTRDLDLLGLGDLTAETLREIFEDVCAVPVEDDGADFFSSGIEIEEIREAENYQGLRVAIPGLLGNIHLHVSVDVGFGDAVVPAPQKVAYPVLLDLPHPKMNAYPREAVVAEKVDAMILFGLQNSRMKDYYDLWTLARYFSFESDTLARALNATLNRRGRDLSPGMPSGLADEFAANLAKQTQWKAFLRRTIPGRTDLDLGEVVSFLRGFLAPVLEAVLSGNTPHFHWTPERGWADKH